MHRLALGVRALDPCATAGQRGLHRDAATPALLGRLHNPQRPPVNFGEAP